MFYEYVSIFVIMMYGRMHSRTWDPGTPPHDVLFCTTLCIDGMRQLWDPEDATWEGEQVLQHPSLQLLEDKQSHAGRTIMSSFD